MINAPKFSDLMQQINETISLQLTYPNSRPRHGHSAAPPSQHITLQGVSWQTYQALL